MRGVILFPTFLLAAGSALGSVPVQPAHLQEMWPGPGGLLAGGRVYLQERPLPGTVLDYPGIFTPLRGPHGGLLAGRPSQIHLG